MRTDIKKIIKITSLSIFIILIIIFAYSRSKDLVRGGEIKDVNIVDGAKVIDNIINITGSAKNANNLTLDGRVISVDLKGNFDEILALLPGYNIVNIKAEHEFGNVDEKNYKLMLEKL